jgi:hypothetical protein
MFNFKKPPKHHFLDGSPFWCLSSRQYGYVDEETGQINIPYDVELTPTDVFAGITVNNNIGDVIFEANRDGVFHGNEPLTTEERVREIFREEYYNILREDTENGLNHL